MCISIIKICRTALNLFFELLCTITKYRYFNPRFRWSQLQCHSNNTFSCVSPNSKMYCAWKTSFKWKETVPIMWLLYRFSCNCKFFNNKRTCNDWDINCWFSSMFIHTFNTEKLITITTCMHYWNQLLWQYTMIGI